MKREFVCVVAGIEHRGRNGTTNAPSEAELSTEVAVRLNDPIHQSICPLCHQPIKDLKHTIICGCGSKIKNTIKFK
ncbi:hypothetical protein [Paenibacillus sp. SSG-1]|uniref:hypothetical protein n=1 Tax=Paenibacillus sp. SSG-1 TaxID=1443669 RepID=UPI001C528619|nr:hypothetical protein [Paenibacillus sp. SSG-1]